MGFTLFVLGSVSGALLVKHIQSKKKQRDIIEAISKTDDPDKKAKLQKRLEFYKNNEKAIVKAIEKKQDEIKKKQTKLDKADLEKGKKKAEQYKAEITKLNKEIAELKKL